MLELERPGDLAQYVGKEIGVSDWFTVDQAIIDKFADATGDHQWIHVDVERAKREMPDISMATVYNCLTALVKCGLVRQVTLERGAARFCPNMQEHCHFYCDECDSVFDVDWTQGAIELPRGFKAKRYELAIHGQCPACARRAN